MEIKRKQTDDELYHYGILGMKWGVRRYQNKDGSLTQQGLKRYNKAMSEYDSVNSEKKKTVKSFKEGNASKKDVESAKEKVSKAKKKVEETYREVEKANKIDAGEKLTKEGISEKDLNDATKKIAITTAAVTIGTRVASNMAFGNALMNDSATSDLISAGLGAISNIVLVSGAFATAAAANDAYKKKESLRVYNNTKK